VNSIAAGLFMFLILMLFSGKFRNFTQDRSRSIAFFFALGVSNTLAIALFYKALQLNLASVVVPLTSTYPLATLLLSHFLLREGERLNRTILIGALFIIGGTILILCSR
jgi:bacterial/archaeal transporter family protein